MMHRTAIKQLFINILITSFLSYSHSAFAAIQNYSSEYLPAVFKLEVHSDNLLVYLGGSYGREDPKHEPANQRKFHKKAPILQISDGKWSLAGEWDCQYCSQPRCVCNNECMKPIPPIPSLKHPAIHPCSEDPNHMCASGRDLAKMGFSSDSINPNAKWDYWIEENPSRCHLDEDKAWFGISFYAGEGIIGMGGLGSYDFRTKQFDLRRPEKLRRYAISKVIKLGEWIWAVTTENLESVGAPPALGLIRYHWKDDEIESFISNEKAMCGFVVHDIAYSQGSLWAATDIGLSRWDITEERWHNYLPDLNSGTLTKEVECNAVYRELLETLPKNTEHPIEYSDTHYNLLRTNLKLYRKNFMAEYLSE